MRKITVEGIEINFNDLTEQKQKELYEKNNKKYKEDASKSIYSEIRKMVAKNEIESSEFLNRMLRYELNGKNDINVIVIILNNEIFEIEEETFEPLAASRQFRCRLKAAELSKDSKFLNKMYRNELEGDNDADVFDAIVDNKIFEMEKETLETLAASDYWEDRQKAARLSKDSKFLNKMYRNELEDDNDDAVFDAIDNNVIFEMEKETLEALAASDYSRKRQKAAELSKDSSFLNQILRKVVKDWQDKDVEDAIFDNKFFEIDEETIEVLKESEYWEHRQKVAELLKDSNELLEMFITELKSDFMDSDVLVTIIENEAFVFEKVALLEYIRNNY